MKRKQHSELEMFMRKMMLKLGLGYQCYYKNRAKNTHRQGTPGHWSISIWDQRPGHYVRRTAKNPDVEIKELYPLGRTCGTYNPYPTQKYYNNQDTDCEFEIIGPEYHGVGAEHKDDFMKWLLFEYDLFGHIGKKINDFEGGCLEGIIMTKALKGEELSEKVQKTYEQLSEELETLKEKYG